MLASMRRSSLPFGQSPSVCRQGRTRAAENSPQEASRSPPIACAKQDCKNRLGLPPRDPMQIEPPPMLLAVDRRLPPTGKMRLRIARLFAAAFRCLDLARRSVQRAVDRIREPDRRACRTGCQIAAKCCRSTSQPDQRRKHRPARPGREILRLDQGAAELRGRFGITWPRIPTALPVSWRVRISRALLLGL